MYSPFKQYKILPNVDNYSDIKKGLRFVAKAISSWFCCPRGASIHEIKESFPLKPSLVVCSTK